MFLSVFFVLRFFYILKQCSGKQKTPVTLSLPPLWFRQSLEEGKERSRLLLQTGCLLAFHRPFFARAPCGRGELLEAWGKRRPPL